jgi:hypothetical protein
MALIATLSEVNDHTEDDGMKGLSVVRRTIATLRVHKY